MKAQRIRTRPTGFPNTQWSSWRAAWAVGTGFPRHACATPMCKGREIHFLMRIPAWRGGLPCAFARQPPVAYEDGQQLRDYVNVRDVARANVLAMENSGGGFWHV